jgi:hypothetical protein
MNELLFCDDFCLRRFLLCEVFDGNLWQCGGFEFELRRVFCAGKEGKHQDSFDYLLVKQILMNNSGKLELSEVKLNS